MTATAGTPKKRQAKPAVRVIAFRFVEVAALEMQPHRPGTRQFGPPGMVQLVRLGKLEDPNLHARTFDRKASRPLHHKFVYVWRARDARGAGLELVDELWFEEGKFQRVPLEGKRSQRGKDERRPEGSFLSELPLLAGSIEEPTTWYFFLLSPAQYPWDALVRIAPEVPARGMRFPDPFWTDLLLAMPGAARGGAPKQVRAWDYRWARGLLRSGAPLLGAQVHLVDPLFEAEQKAARLAKELDAWLAEVKRLHEDDTYTLAKRIAAIVVGQPKLANEVRGPELERFVEESERELVRSEGAVQDACRALVEWIGVEMRLDARGRVLANELDGAPVPAPPPASDARFNAFSQMVRDFAGREVPAAVDRAVARVYERLGESPAGRMWMRHVWEAKDAGKAPVADGGVSLLFEARRAPSPPEAAPRGATPSESWAGAAEGDRRTKDEREAWRKTGAGVSEAVGVLLEHFAPLWEERHVRKVFRQFGIELEEVPGGVKRPQRLAEAREVLAEADVGARLRPRNAEAVRALGKLTPWLQLALEVNNTKRALDELGDADAYAAISLAGNVTDSLAAANEVAQALRPTWTAFKRAAPVLSIIGGSIDTVTGVMDTTAAYEEGGVSGRTAGHGMRTAGGVLAVVGGVLLIANPVGLVGAAVVLVGVAAQFAGSWMVEASSEIRDCLGRSPWGKRGAEFFPAGSPALSATHRALSRAIYRFTARVVASDFGPDGPRRARRLVLRIEVEGEVAKWLPVGASWTVEAHGLYGSSTTWKGWALPRRTVVRPAIIGGKLVLEAPVPGVVIGRTDDFVKVSRATIELSPCLDRRYEVERALADDDFAPLPLFGDGRSSVAH